MQRIISLYAFLLLLSAASTCTAANLQVCPGDCEFRKIQSAVDAAQSGDTIYIAAGRYVENVRIAGKNLQIIGASNSQTVVDGASNGSVFTLGIGENAPAAAISISKLTVTHGMATNGGGVSVLGGAYLSLTGVIVISNVAHNNGAGIYVNSPGSPRTTLVGCSIDNNKVDQELVYTTGGGIAIVSSAVSISSSTITRNIVPLAGGGIGFIAGSGENGGSLSIISSSIVDNQTLASRFANSFVGGGGGVYFDGPGGGTLNISSSDISHNSSVGLGGGLVTDGLTSISSTIIGRNSTLASGGGLATYGSGQALTLTNVYVVQNTAAPSGAGGIDNGGSPLFLNHAIIKDNLPNDCLGTGCTP